MQLHDYLQVNSHFFYFEKEEDIDFVKKYYSCKIKNHSKKFDQTSFNHFMNDVVFQHETSYIHIVTDKGNFLISNVTNYLTKDEVIDILNKNSSNSSSYYFSNVDYFNYGAFAVSENNKIQRYLSCNSEAKDDENVVEWIGKPHKWEYATHTFYTKKKLEDFEMFFDSDTVCEMITFYLPFIENDLNIKEITVYSKDKSLLNKIKKSRKEKDTKPKYVKLPKHVINKIYDLLVKLQINGLSILCHVYSDKIVLTDYFLFTKEAEEFKDSEVLFANLRSDLNYNEANKEIIFHNYLVQLIAEMRNSKFVKITEAAPYIKKIPDNELKRCIIRIVYLNKNSFKIELYHINGEKSSSIYIGKNFNKKSANKIYNEVIKDLSSK